MITTSEPGASGRRRRRKRKRSSLCPKELFFSLCSQTQSVLYEEVSRGDSISPGRARLNPCRDLSCRLFKLPADISIRYVSQSQETGPWSLWHGSGPAGKKAKDVAAVLEADRDIKSSCFEELQSPAFDPKLREEELLRHMINYSCGC